MRFLVTLLKLHRQFSHPPKSRLIILVTEAGVWKKNNDKTLAEIDENVKSVEYMLKLHPGQ